jgi:hypothetical protein
MMIVHMLHPYSNALCMPFVALFIQLRCSRLQLFLTCRLGHIVRDYRSLVVHMSLVSYDIAKLELTGLAWWSIAWAFSFWPLDVESFESFAALSVRSSNPNKEY